MFTVLFPSNKLLGYYQTVLGGTPFTIYRPLSTYFFLHRMLVLVHRRICFIN